MDRLIIIIVAIAVAFNICFITDFDLRWLPLYYLTESRARSKFSQRSLNYIVC